ncbi:hypothetical protein [Paenibacillus popilliae]|uniref:Uncharacterized protein n=1 Tax=Paenibacillus popilliae ATCC 14706 TaxID=1212764 RepID=M9LAR1_PAEPP|nr:hypothetical protein [Paenibacillus popilliae]GAC42782.1 hypothetical protein PPOP_2142 [Paenibacillus popilliae ATCC 14706]
MPIPDELLDHLAERYYREYIDPRKCKFITWAAIEAEKLGFRL